MRSREQTLMYYSTFIDNPSNCCQLVVATLNESYHWLSQSFEEPKNVTCSFRGLNNGYELSCLNDLIKASVEVIGSS
jgi:hypothetical protein